MNGIKNIFIGSIVDNKKRNVVSLLRLVNSALVSSASFDNKHEVVLSNEWKISNFIAFRWT